MFHLENTTVGEHYRDFQNAFSVSIALQSKMWIVINVASWLPRASLYRILLFRGDFQEPSTDASPRSIMSTEFRGISPISVVLKYQSKCVRRSQQSWNYIEFLDWPVKVKKKPQLETRIRIPSLALNMPQEASVEWAEKSVTKSEKTKREHKRWFIITRGQSERTAGLTNWIARGARKN